MASSCWGRHVSTIPGQPARAPALTPSPARWMGPSPRRPVRRASRGAAGRRPWSSAACRHHGAGLHQGWSALRPLSPGPSLAEVCPSAAAHQPAAPAGSGPPKSPATGRDRRLPDGVCAPCRHRRDEFARGSGRTPATDPLEEACAGPSGTSSDGRRPARTAPGRVVPGDLTGEDPSHAVCPADGGWRRSIPRCAFAISITFGDMVSGIQ